jgi:transmembrane sensor
MPGKLFSSWAESRARKQAARWMVRMHGPDAFRWRGAFEAWRLEHPLNSQAYARQQAIWGVMPHLNVTSALKTARPTRRLTPLRLAAGVVPASLALGAVLIWQRQGQPEPFVIAAEPLRARAERLADGSRVLLDRGSALEVSLDPDLRRLRLMRGRARLDLSSGDGRPALIRAGRAEIRTPQARLDIALAGDDARVILLAGEVRLARYDDTEAVPSARRLAVGQLVMIGAGDAPVVARAATSAELAWPAGMISFVDAPLGDVLAHANAASFSRIDLADPSLAALKVTGAYQLGDTAGLARSLAASLGLTVRGSADKGFTLAKGQR